MKNIKFGAAPIFSVSSTKVEQKKDKATVKTQDRPVVAKNVTDPKSTQISYVEFLIKSKQKNNSINMSKPVVVQSVGQVNKTKDVTWHNDLRKLFQENKAVIYCLTPRTFNAKDLDGNGLVEVEKGEERGTFLNAIDRLDELKEYGVNTIHMLPPHPPGKIKALGTAGSLYAPASFLEIDPKLADPKSPLSAKDQMKVFVKEAHKRGIRIMLDLPSCGSVDFFNNNPDLVNKDDLGQPKIPQGWDDIRMLKPYKNEDKKILNEALIDMHKKYIDMCQEIGVDGVRADVARAKPDEFWQQIIPYSQKKDPNFAWLGETYCYEDSSPMLNMPKDRPQDILAKGGFDSYYGQYHIFHEWKKAQDLHDHTTLNLEMTQKMPANKSLIGDFVTHDDISPMAHGGVPYCNLTTGLQATMPMTNPYFLSGFESGDRYLYPYKDKIVEKSDTDSHIAAVHGEMIDIFNFSRKPGGNFPEIGDYMKKILKVRNEHEDVITKGSYIPLKVNGQSDKEDQVISYARHLNGKTLLIIANKDVNAKQQGEVVVPTLKANQVLKDLSPTYGVESKMMVKEDGKINVDLGPARFHIFEIDTPDIEKNVPKTYKQKLELN